MLAWWRHPSSHRLRRGRSRRSTASTTSWWRWAATPSPGPCWRRIAAACSRLPRPERAGGWISPSVARAYGELHRLGWAHSVEAWTREGELVGGLYGVAIGGLFAGESMFSSTADASKVALLHLVGALRAGGGVLLD